MTILELQVFSFVHVAYIYFWNEEDGVYIKFIHVRRGQSSTLHVGMRDQENGEIMDVFFGWGNSDIMSRVSKQSFSRNRVPFLESCQILE